MKKILVVNVNWVGDVIFSTPVFKALKKAYPGSEITCLGVPRVKDVLECSPCVDEIIVYDDENQHSSPVGKLKIIAELRKRKFDAAFILHKSVTRALLTFLAGIPVRVGYGTKGRGPLLTHKIDHNVDQEHRSDYYLNIIKSFGIDVKDTACELNVSDQAKKDIEDTLSKHNISATDNLTVVNVGGNWDLKRWPQKSFSKLIKQLAKAGNTKLVIPGAKKDEELANSILNDSGVNAAVLAGQTGMKQLIALMERANLVISADSGPMHVANSVGTDVVAMFGPTRPEVTGPRGAGKFRIFQNDVGCNGKPCYFLNCPDNICMKSISVDDVIHEINKIKN